MTPYLYLSLRELIAATRPSPLGRRHAFERTLRETLDCDVRLDDLILAPAAQAELRAWMEAKEPATEATAPTL